MSTILEQIVKQANDDLIAKQERYLQDCIILLGISVEEFVANYYLEYDPIEPSTFGDFDICESNTFKMLFRQTVRVKKKEEVLNE